MRHLHAKRGFTLLEIMIVTTIIALLVSMAIPAFRQVRRNAQNTAMANDIRIIAGAMEQYAMEHGVWPVAGAPGVVPPGTQGDVADDVWTGRNPIGGLFEWVRDSAGVAAGIASTGHNADLSQILDLDRKIDDGNLTSGLLVLNGVSLVYVLEQ